ncbi:hypothetical protein [Streptomyces sp. NPDC058247]|uniref:hypothetical protein n=1 Tax=Streptomyces sp. NPDC058247 TaxID=3346401 RepID=UPI0036EF480E
MTRLLCQAVYVRPDRVKAVKAWWRKLRGRRNQPDKPRRSSRRPIYLEGSDDCPALGEPAAQWVLDHVLNGPPLPVPSYGFDLVPVVAHSLRARRHRWVRRLGWLGAVSLLAYASPTAAAIWGAAVVLAALLLWRALHAIRKQKQARGLGSPRVAYVVLCAPWLLPLIPYEPEAGGGMLSVRAGLLLLPVLFCLTGAVVCAGDRLVARGALKRLSGDGVQGGDLPRAGSRAARRMAEFAKDQERPELPYEKGDRFVGAGRDVWRPAHITIPLKAKDPEESVREFGESQLLARIGQALGELGRGAREITDPLPGFTTENVVGLPAAMWLHRTREQEVEFPDLKGLGRRSPSSRPDRLYLRTQCVSWDGHVVVSVFVHAAIEAGELRLTVRPHVMTPLYNELRVSAAPAFLRGTRLWRGLALQSALDAVMSAAALWRAAVRIGAPGEGRAEEADPVSLRDRYSTEEVVDMHQSDDAKRHVVLMQSCVFRTVAVYLEERGIDTAAYERQVASVITNIQIFGDNSAPIQNVAGVGISNVGQGGT